MEEREGMEAGTLYSVGTQDDVVAVVSALAGLLARNLVAGIFFSEACCVQCPVPAATYRHPDRLCPISSPAALSAARCPLGRCPPPLATPPATADSASRGCN